MSMLQQQQFIFFHHKKREQKKVKNFLGNYKQEEKIPIFFGIFFLFCLLFVQYSKARFIFVCFLLRNDGDKGWDVAKQKKKWKKTFQE